MDWTLIAQFAAAALFGSALGWAQSRVPPRPRRARTPPGSRQPTVRRLPERRHPSAPARRAA